MKQKIYNAYVMTAINNKQYWSTTQNKFRIKSVDFFVSSASNYYTL